MEAKRWQVSELFEAAVEMDPEEWANFLAEACNGDKLLLAEVESLLAAHQRAGSFLAPGLEEADQNRTLAHEPSTVAANQDLHQGLVLKDRYLVEKRLGHGGAGIVYLARDQRLHSKAVVIKVLQEESYRNPWFQEKFRQEIQVLARIDHPFVVGVSDIGEMPDGKPFFVMQYVEGTTLRSEIRPEGMSFERVDKIFRQVCQALSAAHGKGICHLDLKPENIMLQDLGNGEVGVKLIDFGIARIQNPDSTGPTHITKLAGTVNYMAPEQLMGKPAISSDIYALGVIAYETVTGQLPFKPDSPFQLLEMQRAGVQVKPRNLRPELSEAAESAILKTLEFEPKGRHQSAREFGEDLARELTVVPERTRSSERANLALPTLRSRWALILLGLPLMVLFFWIEDASIWDYFKSKLGMEPIPVRKHLVVLPFTNIEDDPSRRAFCNGLRETLTSKLTQLEEFHDAFWVVPASEVSQRGITSAGQAQQAFSVNLAVTGSVQRYAKKIRLTINLVDAKTLRQLRSLVIDTTTDNLSSLQDSVLVKLAGILEIELQPETFHDLAAGSTTDAGGYEFYLQGRGYLQGDAKPAEIDAAIVLFEKAIRMDPQYALARAGLAQGYWMKYQVNKDPKWAALAKESCHRALELNSELLAVIITLGYIHTGTGQLEKAEQDFKRALELSPRDARVYRGLAGAYEEMGRLKEAELTYQKAIQLKPDYWGGYNELGSFYFGKGRFQDAVAQFRQVVALTPDNFQGYVNVGACLLNLEDFPAARTVLERSLQLEPSYYALTNLGMIYFLELRYADAARMFQAALKLNDNDHQLWGNLGAAFTGTKEEDKAQLAFSRAIQIAQERLKINKQDPVILADLSTYYVEAGRRPEALPLLKKALSLAPEKAEIQFQAGEVYERLGDRAQALTHIEKSLEFGYSMRYVQSAPALRQLRVDPRFRQP